MRERIEDQRSFYMEKFEQYGDDPRSLSWNSAATQNVRFQILAQLFRNEFKQSFTVHEVGCGLAHFYDFLKQRGIGAEYSGCDICQEFVEYSTNKVPQGIFVRQDIAATIENIDHRVKGKDYYILSGTFNPMGITELKDWESFVYSAINNMFAMCRKGIGFNFLTSYCDKPVQGLFYCNPLTMYDWCTTNLSRYVSVISDYPLYEFTVFVYKEAFLRSIYTGADFNRYYKSKQD